MEIRHLRYFVALYQQSNFTKAAEMLFLSQSALSQQIIQLENELGLALFVRNTRKTVPTEAAHNLYPYAINAISTFDAFLSSAQQLSQKDNNTIKILFQNKLRVTKLVDFLNEFMCLYPDITVEIQDCAVASSEDVSPNDAPNKWDVAFLRGMCCDGLLSSTLYHCNKIMESPCGLIIKKNHPLAAKAFVDSSDLRTIKMLSGQRGGAVDQRIRALGIPEDNIVALFTDDYDILASMLKSGEYATIGVAPFAHYYNFSCIPLLPPCSDSVYMVYSKSKANNHLIAQFKEFILNRYLTLNSDENIL